jgi:spermidine synthase
LETDEAAVITGEEPPVVVERVAGVHGEIALRKCGQDWEIISNGVFLMDTRGGASERLLATAAFDHRPGAESILIGGLGVGKTLAEAISAPSARRAVVVEIEPAVVRWNRDYIGSHRYAVDDPRVRVEIGDVVSWLAACPDSFDIILLDVDNGPVWTVSAGNQRLYGEPGMRLVRSRLTPGGAVAIWSAAPAVNFERILRRIFVHVAVYRVPVVRGEPDIIYVASDNSQEGRNCRCGVIRLS